MSAGYTCHCLNGTVIYQAGYYHYRVFSFEYSNEAKRILAFTLWMRFHWS